MCDRSSTLIESNDPSILPNLDHLVAHKFGAKGLITWIENIERVFNMWNAVHSANTY